MVRLLRLPLCLGLACLAPQPSRAQEAPVRLQAGTQEVLFDFTARDKHEKLIGDLSDSEVAIFENGVQQKVTSFRFRDGADSGTASTPRPLPGKINSQYAPLRDINMVTIVVAAIGTESRQRAVQFVDDFLEGELPQNTWIAVFTLRPTLKIVQPYTTDSTLLKKAVYRAVQGSPSDVSGEYDQVIQRLSRLAAASNPGTFRPLRPGSAEEQGPATGGHQAGLEQQLAKVALQILFQREGPRTLDGLRALERQQASIPGRKTVLLVSEGLLVPPDLTDPLKGIIAEANRNNVTFYTVDARGLSTRESGVAARLASDTLSREGPAAGLAVQHTDFQQNARELAEKTGGFSMENSNDLHAPLRRVMQDVRAHYELTYAPSSQEYNGSFRKIELKVTRPGVNIHGRSGYFALPLLLGMQVEPFEIAALRALQTQPLPHDFAFRAATFRFGAQPDGVAHRIMVEIPFATLQTVADESHAAFRLRVSLMALLKDDKDEILAKAVRDVPYQAPLERLAEFKKGNFSVILPMDIAPGRYHLDLVVLDRLGEKTSIRRSLVMVPPVGTLDASDLIWVRSVQATGERRDPDNPLESAQGHVTPKLDGEFIQTDAPQFMFRVYAGQAPLKTPSAHLTILRDKSVVRSTELAAPVPEPDGSLLFAGTIPAGALPAGDYDLAIAAKEGGRSALITSNLTIR